MFKFSADEKESLKFVFHHSHNRYKTDEIYDRIEGDKMTKADLISAESKARILLGLFAYRDDPNCTLTDEYLLEIGRNVSVLLNALNKYRISKFDPDKYPWDSSAKKKETSASEGSDLAEQKECPSFEVNTHQELLDKLQEGLEDVRNGDVRPIDEALGEIMAGMDT